MRNNKHNSLNHTIEQKGRPLITIFTNSFSFSSSLFLGEKRKGEKNNHSRGQKSCLSAWLNRSKIDTKIVNSN